MKTIFNPYILLGLLLGAVISAGYIYISSEYKVLQNGDLLTSSSAASGQNEPVQPKEGQGVDSYAYNEDAPLNKKSLEDEEDYIQSYKKQQIAPSAGLNKAPAPLKSTYKKTYKKSYKPKYYPSYKKNYNYSSSENEKLVDQELENWDGDEYDDSSTGYSTGSQASSPSATTAAKKSTAYSPGAAGPDSSGEDEYGEPDDDEYDDSSFGTASKEPSGQQPGPQAGQSPDSQTPPDQAGSDGTTTGSDPTDSGDGSKGEITAQEDDPAALSLKVAPQSQQINEAPLTGDSNLAKSAAAINLAEQYFAKGDFYQAAYYYRKLGWNKASDYSMKLSGKTLPQFEGGVLAGPYPENASDKKSVLEDKAELFDDCQKITDYDDFEDDCIEEFDDVKLTINELKNSLNQPAVKNNKQLYRNYCRYADRYSDVDLLNHCVAVTLQNDYYSTAAPLQNKLATVQPNRENKEAYAYILLRNEKFAEAGEYLEKLISNAGPTFLSYNYLGQARFFQKDYSTAAKAFIEASKLNPINEEVYNNIGLCYYFQEEWTQAEVYFTRALQLNPNYLVVMKRLARIYKKTGNNEKYQQMKNRITQLGGQ